MNIMVVASSLLILWLLSCTSLYAKLSDEHACSTIEVRNDATDFIQLVNCTVIEGHLAILLINYLSPSDHQLLRFPRLVEITDYLFLYRVNGLRTLRYMFPNLAVIRGQNLFFSYALVVFEMMHLEEIGLTGLTKIVRGAVRLEKNPTLCYVDTINWQEILDTNRVDDNFILENKPEVECVNVCPKTLSGANVCPGGDVRMPGKTGSVQRPLCWNQEHCQFVCPLKCGNNACYRVINSMGDSELKCCNEYCLGGCTGPTSSDCFACRHVFHSGRCVPSCPEDTYRYLGRRCVTASECNIIMKSILPKGEKNGWMVNEGGKSDKSWMVVNDGGLRECVEECPSGFMEDFDNPKQCKKCEGRCPRECFNLVVDSIGAAQKLRGCTIIRGVLEIQVRGGGQIGRELEESLGMIEEVTDAVKIVHSYALMSLSFLKNLRVIRGERTIKNRYALFVLDNQNLQDIWDYSTHPNLTILNGAAFFQYNRKLCPGKINQLLDYTGIKNKTQEGDIGNNGDQVACDLTELKLTVMYVSEMAAILRWDNFITHDQRDILGWVLYTRAAPEQNLTMFGSRDACGNDLWKAYEMKYDDEVGGEDNEIGYVTELVADLQPFTQYAAYVQTYTISSARSGAISPIIYFTTLPSTPSMPRDIKIIATRANEMTIAWSPPLKPNGNITHYHITCKPQELHRDVFDQRNYCDNKLVPYVPNAEKHPIEDEEKNITECAHCCACPKTEKEIRIEEEERLFQIEFENFLHNTVYKKRPPDPLTEETEDAETINRRKRRRRKRNNRYGEAQLYNSSDSPIEWYEDVPNFASINDTEMDDNDTNITPPVEREKMMKMVVYGSHQANITGLDHFQDYIIEVVACQDSMNSSENQTKLCSKAAIVMARTMPDPNADAIDGNNMTAKMDTNDHETFRIHWSEPISPNGLIVTYDIDIDLVSTPKRKMPHCIRHSEFHEVRGYHTEKLQPGNYSYRVRATSLAGPGPWTAFKYFHVVDKDRPMPIPLIISIVIIVTIVLLIIVAMSVWWITKKRFAQMDIAAGYASINPDYFSTDVVHKVYVADEWEIPRDKVKIIKELGQGSFGMVYEGLAHETVLHGEDECVPVAIKTVNEKASARDRMEFLNEASVMKDFNCYHVVRLWGVVSKSQPTLVIMELMSRGDLKNYLRQHRPDSEDNCGEPPPQLSDIIQMAAEIADGMAYLAAKKYVHRDLAARNCMVSAEGVVKIGDFGMTRDVYETDYYRKGGKGLLPIRWMAPESLNDGRFTSQSDVWAMGVVLWEMVTLAAQPYLGLSNEEVLSYVCSGKRMEKPEGCPDQLYEMMLMCWRQQPKDRPTFCEIIEILVPYLQLSFHDVSFFFSAENQELMAQSRHNQANTITLDFSSLCPRTDIDMDWTDQEAHSPDVHTPLLNVKRNERLNSASSPDFDHELDDVDSDSHLSSSQPKSWYCGTDEHPLSDKSDKCECVELKPTPRTMQYGTERLPTLGGGDAMNGASLTNRQGISHVNKEMSPTASNDGSKGSGKSTASSVGLNGFSNGHLPYGYPTHAART